MVMSDARQGGGLENAVQKSDGSMVEQFGALSQSVREGAGEKQH
jgi:hypothetical protein